MKDFVHLHVHTQYSLLDGAIRADRLFGLAKSYGMKACAITDHGNMFGAVDFFFEGKKAGMKPLIGCEAYLAPKSRFDQKKVKGEDNAYHILLLAMNDQGYKNLMKLISIAHTEGFYYVPRIDKEVLRTYNEGLICLTACLKGEIPNAIIKYDDAHVNRLVDEYISIFGDRLYFELQDNGIEEQKKINEGLVKLSRNYGVPIVATNDCHYLKKEEAKAHDLLLCIQTGKTINDKDRLSFSSDHFYFKSPDEVDLAFSQYPEALANTVEVAERCNLVIDTETYHFPEFKPPDNMSLNDYIEELTREGFNRRLPAIRALYSEFGETLLDRYRQRLDYEIGVIKKTGFSGYFLIVADFINYAKCNNIPVGPGRGSAAGSLVAYCLGITDIDPIKYDLTFERFLNPERISMPDIDVDFCKNKRDRVIQYVTEKYGKDNVAQIITFGTMKSKAAVRDVGRALGMPYAEVDKIAKLIVSTDRGIERAINEEPQIGELYRTNEQVKELLDNAIVVEGLARHASTHAAGIVIANKHLSEYVPLYRGQHEETVTQYHMKVIEKIGLIKMDFLGLETLTLIDSVIRLLKNEDINLEIDTIPLDDQKTFDLLASGDTSGVFQLESRGMKDLLTKLKPSKFEDIMPLIALYRPGPLNSGMVDEFIKRKNNPDKITYETPLLEGILQDTYGVIIYQEQIMKIASVLANFSLKDADTLRKAMSKKIPEELTKYRAQFIEGAKANNVPAAVAEKIYDVIVRFGEYGFNKSHSTAYGLISYQTAYLKAHYPVHYFAAMLTNEVNDTDKMIKYIAECREAGIEILPPDVNKSDKAFTIIDNKIRYGLSGIKNVGDAAIEHILEIRNRIGEFDSFIQFLSEVDTKKGNKKVIEALVKTGCFDCFGLKRSQLLHLLNEKSEILHKRGRNNGNQMDMFGMFTEKVETIQVPDMEELPYDDILRGEKESLGFYFSEHPLKAYEHIINRISRYDTQSIREKDIDDDVDIAGIVSTNKEITTKRGDKMAYLTLEDTKGTVETIVFPDLYSQSSAAIKSDRPLLVSGTVERGEDGNAKLKAKGIKLLEEATRDLTKTVQLRIYCDRFRREDLKKLRDIILGIRGKSALLLEFVMNGEKQALPLDEVRIDHSKMDIVLKHFGGSIDYEVIDAVLP